MIKGYDQNKYNFQIILHNKYYKKKFILNDANVMDIRNLVMAPFYKRLRGFTDDEGCFQYLKEVLTLNLDFKINYIVLTDLFSIGHMTNILKIDCCRTDR